MTNLSKDFKIRQNRLPSSGALKRNPSALLRQAKQTTMPYENQISMQVPKMNGESQETAKVKNSKKNNKAETATSYKNAIMAANKRTSKMHLARKN